MHWNEIRKWLQIILVDRIWPPVSSDSSCILCCGFVIPQCTLAAARSYHVVALPQGGCHATRLLQHIVCRAFVLLLLGRLLNDGEFTSSVANHSSVACSEGYHTNPCGDTAAQSGWLLQVSEKLGPNIETKVRFQYCLDENCWLHSGFQNWSNSWFWQLICYCYIWLSCMHV